MSAGDIDDRLGPKGELERLASESSELEHYLSLMDDLPIKRATIPFGAGISEDGQTRYVHEALNTDLNGVDISPAIATHESVEWALRKFCNIGEDYAEDPRGHRLANRAEYEKVSELFEAGGTGEDIWDAYDSFLDPQLRALEHAPLTNVPKDLSLYPYESDEVMMQKLREAQHGTNQ